MKGHLLMPVQALCGGLFQFQKLVAVLPSVLFPSLTGRTKDSISVKVSSLLEMQAFSFPSRFTLPTSLACTWSKSQARTSCFSVALCFLKEDPEALKRCWTLTPSHMQENGSIASTFFSFLFAYF